MTAASVAAALATEAQRPLVARKPIPCRPLGAAPGRVSPTSLVRHLACVPIPARSLALLTGNPVGMLPVEASVVKWAHAQLRSLVRSLTTAEGRASAYRPVVAALTGLGPGLTPTGDDLLVGLAAMAQRLSAVGLVDARAAVAYSAALGGLSGAETTPASRELLAKAASGLYPAVLASVVEVFGSPQADRPTLIERAGVLTRTGAHSGADLLAGALALVRGVLEFQEKR